MANMMINISLSLVTLSLMIGTALALDIETSGRIESRVGLINHNGSGDSNNLIHIERINWGLQQEFDFLAFNYSLTGGGLMRGSSQFDKSQITPEYQAKVQIVPFRQLVLELFSYSQMRNPMQIAQDTLQNQEQMTGIQLSSQLGNNGRIVAAFGSRNFSKNNSKVSHQFMKIQLEQKVIGLQFRLLGEKDLYTKDMTSGEDDRSNMSIQWYGSPIKGLNWTAINSVHNIGGEAFWRIYQRLNYQLSTRSTLWAHVNNQQVAYKGSYLNTQNYDIDYRRKMGELFALQLLSEGSKVKPLSGNPVFHWRSYLTGLHWRVGGNATSLGVLQFGFKESYRFGSGMDFQYELEERIPLLQNRLLRVGLSDHSVGELFVRTDAENNDPRYDIDHQLEITIDLWPGQKVQVANSFRMLNHFGTDLDFSEDTLRNALTHNIQFKYIQRKLRASIDHLTIRESGDDGDLRLHLNTRFSYHLKQGTSLNLISLYRYSSEVYPDYVWLNSFVKINMQNFDWALEVQTQGSPDEIFNNNFSVWMRFMRQL